MGGEHKRALLVGDSETDVKTARAAGVPVILVSFGYTEIPVAKLGGDAIIDSFDELPAAISRLLG
jgi:phosphoglycolate phosphatase